MQYNKDAYVLIKSPGLPFGYRISPKEAGRYILFDDEKEVENIIAGLLKKGVDIYGNEEEFRQAFPSEQLTFEERKERSIIAWALSVPEKYWSEEIKQVMENRPNKNSSEAT